MRYIILLGDGMADYPLEELKGKTPLEYAHTPYMDMIASQGTIGLIDTIPAGFSPGSDVAIMTVLGYDPKQYYTGRGPLEAASMRLQLGDNDVAFRCNLVTLGGDEQYIMDDFTAGHITSQEAQIIINDIGKELGSTSFQFYPGVSYRNLLVWRDGKYLLETTPPHDITGRAISNYLPRGGNGVDQLNSLMTRSQAILKDHPVNRLRLKRGEKPVSSIWLWGQGRVPKFEKLTDKYNLRGGMISAVDLLNGIAVCAGLQVISVAGATGYTDTNYSGKASKALDALKDMDFVFVHVEAPDEMGHEGNIQGKIKAIEDFDKKVVGTILSEIYSIGPFRLLVLSDHPTPISLRTHASDPSPFAVLSSDKDENLRNGSTFSESSAKGNGVMVSPGNLLMDSFIRNWRGFVEEKLC
jgi:2,3-bisphosphoglycerate-independent phosphoglycerate mutase